MATRFFRRAEPVSGSCPACLGDLGIQRAFGLWALVCSGCGLVVVPAA